MEQIPLSHRARLSSWLGPWLAVLLAGAAAFAFHAYTVSRAQSSAHNPTDPFIKVGLGADLWTLTDSSLLDHNPRRFPAYEVETLESRSAVTFPRVALPGELVVLVPAERFLTEEFLRHPPVASGARVEAGPVLRSLNLALVMTPATREQILRTSAAPPRTLLDWLNSGAAASEAAHPVTFFWADPQKCNATWLAAAELTAEKMGGLDATRLGAVSDAQLAATAAELKTHVTVRGASDRLEMYKLLLGRYPPGAVLLVYGHLATPLLEVPGGQFTAVFPEMHFHPVVQAVAVSRAPGIDFQRYLPSLLEAWRKVGLVEDVSSSPAVTGNLAGDRVPPYATMKRLLDAWSAPPAAPTDPPGRGDTP